LYIFAITNVCLPHRSMLASCGPEASDADGLKRENLTKNYSRF